MLVLIGGVALPFIFLEGISLAPGVGAGRLLNCSPDVRSMTGACGRHLRATSCRLLQPLLVSTSLSLSLSLSLSVTPRPLTLKSLKSLPKNPDIFQSQKKSAYLCPPQSPSPPVPLLMKDLPGHL